MCILLACFLNETRANEKLFGKVTGGGGGKLASCFKTCVPQVKTLFVEKSVLVELLTSGRQHNFYFIGVGTILFHVLKEDEEAKSRRSASLNL